MRQTAADDARPHAGRAGFPFAWRAAHGASGTPTGPPALTILTEPTPAVATGVGLRGIAIAAIAVAFLCAYWFSFPRNVGERPTLNSPRESIGYFLTERFLDGHGFSAPLQHYGNLPRDVAVALTPRDSANLDGNVLPKDFAGTLILHAGAMALNPAIALILGPAFAVLGAWALMRIGEELFSPAVGLIAFVAWLAFPPLWLNASFIFSSDMPALAFFLLAMLMFVRYWRRPTTLLVVLLAFFGSLSIFFRYPNVLLMVPPAAALLLGRRVVFGHAVAALSIGAAFTLFILAFNAFVYGDPLTTGFHLGAELISETVNYSQESLFKWKPEVAYQYIETYTQIPFIAVPVAAGLVSATIVALKCGGTERMFAVVSLAVIGILFAYYGQQDAWGYRGPQLSASFLRYLLPGFALAILFAAWALASMSAYWRWAPHAGLATLLVSGAYYVWSAPGGVHEVYDVVHDSSILRNQVDAATPPDAIISVRIMDKVLFPDRQTMTQTYMIQNDEPFPKGGRETWDYVPSAERFAEVASSVDSAGIAFYLLPDSFMGDLQPYEDALLARGLTLRRVDAVTVADLYEIAPGGVR